MPEPLVSVIIPMYNHARYVRECLDSLLNEGWPNLEVLVLDDGSKDNSFEVVQQWRQEYPTAFSRFELNRQENHGVTYTLNRLVEMAKGEYVTLVASDDCLLPGGIVARVQTLQEHPEWLGVFGDSVVIDEQNKKVLGSGLTQLYPVSARPKALLEPRLIHLEMILRWTVPGPGLLVKREAYDDAKGVGLYDESLAVEDRDFYFRLLGEAALGFVAATVAAYRVHASNSIKVSGNHRKKHYDTYAKSARKACQRAKGLERFALWADSWRFRILASDSPQWFPLQLVRLCLRVLRIYQDFKFLYFQRGTHV